MFFFCFFLQKESQAGEQSHAKMAKALMLSISYAANIGGTATLTGTGPNLVFAGQINT